MRLLSVELRRFVSRRANLVFAIIGLLFLAGSLTILAISSHQPTQLEISQAEAQAEEEREVVEKQLEECEEYWRDNPDADPQNPDPADFEDGEVEEYGYERDCELYYGTEDIEASHYLGNVLSFADEAPSQLLFLGMVFIVCALLMAGSFVGAEWTSGGMTNLLLWRPRRLPVYTAKLTAALISVVSLTVLAAALHFGGLYLIALFRGEVGDLPASWWEENGLLGLRLLALVAVAVVWGFALSMIGRRTVIALGAVVGYGVLIEYVLRGMLDTVNVLNVEYWMLSTHLIAWLADGYEVYHGYEGTDYDLITKWEGGAVVLGVTVVLLAGSAVLFRRRDTA